MTRGIRGATTVVKNSENEILLATVEVVKEMIEENDVSPEQVSHIFFSVTEDLNASFPAKAVRELEGWQYVPVMCMREIPVPNSLPKCIRVMMVAEIKKTQKEIKHIFKNDAIKLRPDLSNV